MPNLKNSIISEILNNLNYGDFCREDFTTHFPDGSSTLAKLVFSSLPKYEFEIEEHVTGGNRFAVALMQQPKPERKKSFALKRALAIIETMNITRIMTYQMQLIV